MIVRQTLTALFLAAAMLSPGISMAAETPSAQTQSGNQSTKVEASGVVLDQQGEPIIGAAVTEVGNPNNGIGTDYDGNFTLKVKPGAKLRITYVGCKPIEVEAGANMTITMQDDNNLLDEIVVVGFGTQKKVNLTGSVSVADQKALSERPVNSAAQALQGVVPGLQITTSNGSLETNPSINIRGTGTIGEGSSGSPLILIDGMEGDINTINPQDIESISVLKDAAAASIYGSRAPFGVILIKTKSGGDGRVSVNYNNSFRFSNLINMAHTMDSYTFANYFNYGCENTAGWGPHFSSEWVGRILNYQLGKFKDSTIPNGTHWGDYDRANDNIDWYGTVYKKSNFSQEHNLSVSGGTEKIHYYFSANFLNQPGMIAWGKEGLKRYNLTGKFSADLFKWLNFSFSTRWTRSDYIRPATLTDNLYQVLGRQGWPVLPLYDPNGHLFDAPSPVNGLLNGGSDKTQTDDNYNQIALIFRPLKGWDIHAEFNYRVLSKKRHWDSQYTYNYDVEGNPYIYNSNSNVHEDYYKENFLNFNVYSNYDWTIRENHNFHVMLGFQAEKMSQTAFGVQRNGILIPGLPVLDLTTGADYYGTKGEPSINGEENEWSTAGFFGRINYDYKGRYLVEANLRYDGTSRFRADRRWIWLPSVSLGWNIAREDFWQEFTPVCNTLKLRASYGVLGNQNTTNWYQTYRLLQVSMASGSWLQNGSRPNTVGFPPLVSTALTWEKVYNWNIGLDWGLFNNRLTGSFEYFVRDTKNMVGPAPELPATLGTSVPKTNNTDLRTNGWDFEIAWNDRTSFGLGYGARFVLSDARTKITSYPNNPSNALSNYIAGRYTGEIWGYETIGIAKTDQEMEAHLASLPNGGQSALGSNWAAGDIMYRDLNGDGKIDSGAWTLDDHGDAKLLGNNTPRYMFSLDLTADYKGFDLRVFFQGVAKRDYWQGSSYFWGIEDNFWWSQGLTAHEDYFRATDLNYLPDDFENRSAYTVPANTDAYYPRPIFDGGGKNKQTQSRYMQDASYIRLKNLQVGYTLPQAITQKAYIQKARIFFSGENLWTGTKLRKLFDPETLGSGWGGCAYPLSRTFSFGLSITI